MKSYFRRFRHVRGWFYNQLVRDRIYDQLSQSLSSFFKIRIIYWLMVDTRRISFDNARYRSLAMTLARTSDSALAVADACNSQDNYVETFVTHPNIHSDIEIYNHRKQLLSQYV